MKHEVKVETKVQMITISNITHDKNHALEESKVVLGVTINHVGWYMSISLCNDLERILFLYFVLLLLRLFCFLFVVLENAGD